MNFEKYNPLAKIEKPQDVVCCPADETTTSCVELPRVTVLAFEKLPLNSWQDSTSVVALSSHLKGIKSKGIRLVYGKDSSFSLKFDPGLRPERDPERWQLAVTAWILLANAMGDLLELKKHGLLWSNE